MKVFKLIPILFFFISCGEDIHRMERRVKNTADSLFQLEYPSLIKTQDSICTILFQSNRQELLDSIVQLRKQEIIQLQKGL